MAHKKRKKKAHGTRSRRSRSMGAINVQAIGMKIAGIAGAAFADNLITKNMSTLDPKIVGVVEIAAGVLLPRFMKGGLGEGLSDGLVAVGTIKLLKGFHVISGVGAVPAMVPLRRGAIGPNAPAIGAAGRAYLNNNVGNMMPADQREMMMGALMMED